MKALILVDLQNDFMPEGALAVPEGDRVVPLANRIQAHFDLIVASQDWHPENHASFAANHPGRKPGDLIMLDGLKQTLWPVHCVQNTQGAAFHPDLNLSRIAKIFHKGVDPQIDSYSCFFDNAHRKATGLGDFLKEQKVRDVFLCGLATDYCVRFSALDALELGFRVFVFQDACRGVNLQPEDAEKAIEEMRRAGAEMLTTAQLPDGRSGA